MSAAGAGGAGPANGIVSKVQPVIGLQAAASLLATFCRVPFLCSINRYETEL